MHEQTTTNPQPAAIPPSILHQPADDAASLIDAASRDARTIATIANEIEDVDEIDIADLVTIGRKASAILQALRTLKTQLAPATAAVQEAN